MFKRHLAREHGAEQGLACGGGGGGRGGADAGAKTKARRGGKRGPSSSSSSMARQGGLLAMPLNGNGSGKCSTCGVVFENAQALYDHLDDCVLKVVQRVDPSEESTIQKLMEVESDEDVKKSLGRHRSFTGRGDSDMKSSVGRKRSHSHMYQENDSGHENEIHEKPNDGDVPSITTQAPRTPAFSAMDGRPPTPVTATQQPNTNLSFLAPTRTKNNKSNSSLPSKPMKRRILLCYDGSRRLSKDEIAFHSDDYPMTAVEPTGVSVSGAHTAHINPTTAANSYIRLPTQDTTGRDAYITPLDIETLNRAMAIAGATSEEKGGFDYEMERMRRDRKMMIGQSEAAAEMARFFGEGRGRTAAGECVM